MQLLLIKVPKGNEYTIEQTYAFLANLVERKKFQLPFFRKKSIVYSLEVICSQQKISFVVGVPDEKAEFLKAQLLAQFKEAIIERFQVSGSGPPATASSPASQARRGGLGHERAGFQVLKPDYHFAQLSLARPDYLPLKTAEQFKDVDPLSSVLATMAKAAEPDHFFLYQILLTPANKNWQDSYLKLAQIGGGKDHNDNPLPHPQKKQIEDKAKHPGFKTYIRLLTNQPETLAALADSFGIYTNPTGNSLTKKSAGIFGKKKLLKAIWQRRPKGTNQILNLAEISSLWHLPNQQINLPNIAWGRQTCSEPPENLPASTSQLSKEEKQQITFIGKTEFKNQETTFGVKRTDRERHIYIIGKTGTGKSTLIANMAIEDIRKGEGVAVVDPHGDLIQILLNYIPRQRINDVCYFNAADPKYTYPLNPLEVTNPSQRELVSSGIVSIFHKLYAHSWGPRLEHILRNTLLTLTLAPGTTLGDVIRILTEKKFREQMLAKISDKTMLRFWQREFEPMGERLKAEAISPILNKVGQFVSSPKIRQILDQPKSRVKIETIMNEGKILLCDLSQGKIGEDNSALLGAMVITQIQLAAMNRVFQPEKERRPFHLFVDEFQNFATQSFVKILSEARKYKLNLTLANQYMAQLDREVQEAILGNVGTLISFVIGAQDAYILDREFGKEFSQDDLVSLGRFQVLLKLCIDNETSNPFYATTMPLPACVNKNRGKIIRNSRERFGKKIKN